MQEEIKVLPFLPSNMERNYHLKENMKREIWIASYSLNLGDGSSPQQDQRGSPKQRQADHMPCQEEEQAMTGQQHVQSLQQPLQLLFPRHDQHGQVIYLPPVAQDIKSSILISIRR